MPAFALRPESCEDLDFLKSLYASVRAQELAAVPWSDQHKAAFLTQQFEARRGQWLERFPQAERSIVIVDDEDAGSLFVDRTPETLVVVDLALLPHFRNRGVGTQLMETFLEEAAQTKRIVSLHVEQSNPALRLYRRLGFRTVEEQGLYLRLESRQTSPRI